MTGPWETRPGFYRAVSDLYEAYEARIARDRDEDEPCQRGIIGCCIDHHGEREDTCETW